MGEVDDGTAAFRLDLRQPHHEGACGPPEIDHAAERREVKGGQDGSDETWAGIKGIQGGVGELERQICWHME